jgi:hypothetical protein
MTLTTNRKMTKTKEMTLNELKMLSTRENCVYTMGTSMNSGEKPFLKSLGCRARS